MSHKGLEIFSLQGKRVLITGGSQGIGFGIAEQAAAAGADLLALLAKEEEATIEEAAAKLRSKNNIVRGYSFDLSQLSLIEETYQKISQDCGGFDILFNCAGITIREPAEKLQLHDWQRVIDINLTAVFLVSQAFARECIKHHKKGKIINIASLMSEAARPGTAAYAASKGAVKQLTKALAVDWASYGINVNAIGPGYIRTPFTEKLTTDPQFDAWVKSRTPLGRWGLPQDIAATAIFLASSAADFITGQVIYVDGGWLATF